MNFNIFYNNLVMFLSTSNYKLSYLTQQNVKENDKNFIMNYKLCNYMTLLNNLIWNVIM